MPAELNLWMKFAAVVPENIAPSVVAGKGREDSPPDWLADLWGTRERLTIPAWIACQTVLAWRKPDLLRVYRVDPGVMAEAVKDLSQADCDQVHRVFSLRIEDAVRVVEHMAPLPDWTDFDDGAVDRWHEFDRRFLEDALGGDAGGPIAPVVLLEARPRLARPRARRHKRRAVRRTTTPRGDPDGDGSAPSRGGRPVLLAEILLDERFRELVEAGFRARCRPRRRR